ncbi:MAG: hypothetical protein IJY42_00170, partial [Clostridia bacterium]|nr:hypothetical protein [Clostridia bacterium]
MAVRLKIIFMSFSFLWVPRRDEWFVWFLALPKENERKNRIKEISSSRIRGCRNCGKVPKALQRLNLTGGPFLGFPWKILWKRCGKNERFRENTLQFWLNAEKRQIKSKKCIFPHPRVEICFELSFVENSFGKRPKRGCCGKE